MTVNDIDNMLNQGISKNRIGSDNDKVSASKPGLGITRPNILDIAKGIEEDSILADELYSCPGADMKLLAALIDSPNSYTRDELKGRADQLYPTKVGEVFSRRVLARSPYAVEFVTQWAHSDDAMERCNAYHTLAELCRKRNRLGKGYFRAYLSLIVSEIENEEPSVRMAMKSAAEAICKRCPGIPKRCRRVMARIRSFTEASQAVE